MIFMPPPYRPLPPWWYLPSMLPDPEILKKYGKLSLEGLRALKKLAYEKGCEHRACLTARAEKS